jgi:diaminopimelate epimerase|tara:strand:- start:466 stop:1251 length:786 start_codon:yes stop_codon:yes gene_type:complete
MKINFSKFNGAGNDFIIIDNRNNSIDYNSSLIKHICDRNFGIGGDGLILINESDLYDFEILHYTSDGQIGSLCGNGSRCAISFAYKNNIIGKKTVFEAFDGIHNAEIIDEELVKMEMKINSKIIENEYGTWLDTGSPHLIIEKENIDELDVNNLARKIRYNEYYKENGVNVNFIEKISDETFKIRTYERGVENETLACGTGSTASAICMNYLGNSDSNIITMKCRGGNLKVEFNSSDQTFTNISITGPAIKVFEGTIIVKI